MTAEQIRKLSDDDLAALAQVEVISRPAQHDFPSDPGDCLRCSASLSNGNIYAPPAPIALASPDYCTVTPAYCTYETAAFALVDALMARGWTPNIWGCLADNGEQSWYCRMEYMKPSASGNGNWYVAEEVAVGHINRCRAITEACVLAALATEEKK